MRTVSARMSIFRLARIEVLEPRTMMSASPHGGRPDFVLDYLHDVPAQTQPTTRFSFSGDGASERALSSMSLAMAHAQTGLTTARSNYGLSGRGQTVAVIDTGIAFNHAALGGAWGASVE